MAWCARFSGTSASGEPCKARPRKCSSLKSTHRANNGLSDFTAVGELRVSRSPTRRSSTSCLTSFWRRLEALATLDHFDMLPAREEATDQALLLRGHRDFEDRPAYKGVGADASLTQIPSLG